MGKSTQSIDGKSTLRVDETNKRRVIVQQEELGLGVHIVGEKRLHTVSTEDIKKLYEDAAEAFNKAKTIYVKGLIVDEMVFDEGHAQEEQEAVAALFGISLEEAETLASYYNTTAFVKFDDFAGHLYELGLSFGEVLDLLVELEDKVLEKIGGEI